MPAADAGPGSSRPSSSSQARRPLLDTQVLQSFVAIAECGSFTRAARQVFRSPSALSMQIRQLEDLLGHWLFVREARGVRLTPEGELLLGYARQLLRLNEEAVIQFLAPSLQGTVRLGAPEDLGTHTLPDALARFAAHHPAVQVDVTIRGSDELLRQLEAGELEVALVTTPQERAVPVNASVVFDDPLVWACREGAAAPRRSPLPLALASLGCPWRAAGLAALDRAGMAYRIAYTSDHCAGQEAAMLADLAVSPYPARLVEGLLRKVPADVPLPDLGNCRICLVRAPEISVAGQALAQHVLDALGELASQYGQRGAGHLQADCVP